MCIRSARVAAAQRCQRFGSSDQKPQMSHPFLFLVKAQRAGRIDNKRRLPGPMHACECSSGIMVSRKSSDPEAMRARATSLEGRLAISPPKH